MTEKEPVLLLVIKCNYKHFTLNNSLYFFYINQKPLTTIIKKNIIECHRDKLLAKSLILI